VVKLLIPVRISYLILWDLLIHTLWCDCFSCHAAWLFLFFLCSIVAFIYIVVAKAVTYMFFLWQFGFFFCCHSIGIVAFCFFCHSIGIIVFLATALVLLFWLLLQHCFSCCRPFLFLLSLVVVVFAVAAALFCSCCHGIVVDDVALFSPSLAFLLPQYCHVMAF